MADEKVVLDKETFKALSVDSRLTVLKLLKLRRHTLSELAAELKLSQSTVKEHLAKLEEADLIKQMDEGRKWKYYRLTPKGKNVVDPREVKVLFLFAASIIGAVSAVVLWLRETLGQGVSHMADFAPEPMAAEIATNDAAPQAAMLARSAPAPEVSTAAAWMPDVWILVLFIIGLLGILASVIYFSKQKTKLQQEVGDAT